MTSVNGHNIHRCPSCCGELTTPRYTSYNVHISGPLLSWVKCSHCNNTFELGKETLLGYLPPLPPIPLYHGGFDLVGETFEEQMQDLKRQTAAFHAINGGDLNRPPAAVFVHPPKSS